MNLHSRAVLRNINTEDLSMLLVWRNQESIRKVMFNNNIITFEDHIEWFNNLEKSTSSVSKIFYFDEIPYGVLNVSNINIKDNTCEWGFYLGNQSSPKGMGTILGYTALQYIFYDLNIRKLSAKVINNNDKSIIFHEKLGFTQEGLLRDQIMIDNSLESIVLYGYLQYEWETNSYEIKEKIERKYI